MRENMRQTARRDMPIGKLTEIPNFLPPPEKLIPPDDMVKVTIALDRLSLQFFKRQAAKMGTKYQKMIREVIRGYVAHYSQR